MNFSKLQICYAITIYQLTGLVQIFLIYQFYILYLISKKRNDPSKVKHRSQYQGSKDSQTGSMIEQLTDGTYECIVCCETVRCDTPIWSCRECYTVFHMKCIKKWAKSTSAAAEGRPMLFHFWGVLVWVFQACDISGFFTNLQTFQRNL